MKRNPDKYFHSIEIVEEKCIGCTICMKVCPTQAIRVKNEVAVTIPERCIDCGECIRVCPQNAIIPLTTEYQDLKKFKYTVALPSPVLYSQFGPDVMPNDILLALKKIGFDDVYDQAWSCEVISKAIELFLEDKKHYRRPIISSTCPAVVRLIQIRFPSLLDLIVPVEYPRELSAKEIKSKITDKLKIPEKDIGLIHITPCPAKMISIYEPPTREKSHLDGAIAIKDIYGALLNALKDVTDSETILQRSGGIGIGWAISGGEVKGLKFENCLAVSGVKDTIRILEDVESGILSGIEFLECLVCPGGCIRGPLTVQNPHIARTRIEKLIKMFGEKSRVNEEKVKKLYKKGYFFFKKRIDAAPVMPLSKDPSEAIRILKRREEVLKELPGKDCGACGAPDCRTFAEDVAKGIALIDECVFRIIQKAEVKHKM
ncbi:ferredoxin [candidate division KSB1 bacterium]|nr:MAG: ferredoxin [candidate division KSB1 bacterium]